MGESDNIQQSILHAKAMIKLDQFLKLQGVVSTGGEAKFLIQNSEVKVNGDVEIRRGRKLAQGDIVEIFNECLTVQLDSSIHN